MSKQRPFVTSGKKHLWFTGLRGVVLASVQHRVRSMRRRPVGLRCAYIGWGEEEASLMDVDDDGFVTLAELLAQLAAIRGMCWVCGVKHNVWFHSLLASHQVDSKLEQDWHVYIALVPDNWLTLTHKKRARGSIESHNMKMWEATWNLKGGASKKDSSRVLTKQQTALGM